MDAAVLGTDCRRSPKSLSSAQAASLCSARIEKTRTCLQGDHFVRCCHRIPPSAFQGFSGLAGAGGVSSSLRPKPSASICLVQRVRSGRERSFGPRAPKASRTGTNWGCTGAKQDLRSGPEKGVITKGVFSLEESLESPRSLNSLENGRILLCFQQSGGSLESLESLNCLESLENGLF